MLNGELKKKSLWVIWALSLMLVLLTIFIVAMIYKIGLSNFIENCSELFEDKKETWVILVAGSKGWYNYRHQADVAHAYQILLNNGLPIDHIVVMMTDDVAYDTENPYPGQLFNSPDGSNVYQDLHVDYSGEDVKSENFLYILTGNKTAMQHIGSGRVIESKQKDNIFVNFVGHGSSGILAFPEDYLYADELNIALRSMFISGRFHRMLLYIEACKAGSLFDGILSENSNIFAVTAAGPRESSWAIYCSGDADNETSIICLGDEFSVTWIEDQANIGVLYPWQVNEFVERRTVLNHFNHIRALVKLSNVMPYGDFSVGQDKLSSYIGKSRGVFPTNNNHYNTRSSSKNNTITTSRGKVLKKSTKLYQLSKNRNGFNNTMNKRRQYSDYNKNVMRKIMDQVFDAIFQGVVKQWPRFIGSINEFKRLPRNLPLNVFPCYRQSLDFITKNCFSLPKNIYALNAVHIFFNLCTRVIDDDEWTQVQYDMAFNEVVHNVCSNNSTFSNLLKITDIY